jgi:hypothetical protein
MVTKYQNFKMAMKILKNLKELLFSKSPEFVGAWLGYS